MAILSYEDHGAVHKVYQSKYTGKIIMFVRRSYGERWQTFDHHGSYVSCRVWDNVHDYLRDQDDWKKWSKWFSRTTKSRTRPFWLKEELVKSRQEIKRLRHLVLQNAFDAACEWYYDPADGFDEWCQKYGDAALGVKKDEA